MVGVCMRVASGCAEERSREEVGEQVEEAHA
jgi:hypothetical protein